MTSFSWPQVHTWRLKQHGLSPHLQRKDFLDAIICACGLQAQVMSAAILWIWARTDYVTQEDIQKALWGITRS